MDIALLVEVSQLMPQVIKNLIFCAGGLLAVFGLITIGTNIEDKRRIKVGANLFASGFCLLVPLIFTVINPLLTTLDGHLIVEDISFLIFTLLGFIWLVFTSLNNKKFYDSFKTQHRTSD